MVQLTTSQRRLGVIASLLGIMQGLTWFVMALLCLILYYNGTTLNKPETYAEQLNAEFYHRFLDQNYKPDDVIITPSSFTITSWIYLISGLTWEILSAIQLYYVYKNNKNLLNVFKFWGVLTTFISLVDFFLVLLLGLDFDSCISDSTGISFESACTTIIIPVLVIAARGFVLWIINLIFVYILYKIVKRIKMTENFEKRLFNSNLSLPRAAYQPDPKPLDPKPLDPSRGNLRASAHARSLYEETDWSRPTTQQMAPIQSNPQPQRHLYEKDDWYSGPRNVPQNGRKQAPPVPGGYGHQQTNQYGRY